MTSIVSAIANVFVTIWNTVFTGIGGGIADFAKLLFMEHTTDATTGAVTYSGDLSVFAIIGLVLGALAGALFLVRGIIRWVQARKGA